MEGLDLIGTAVVAFVAYLYLPATIFRFAAENYVDLRPNADSSDLRDFISAALPSSILNVLAWAFLKAFDWLPERWFVNPEVNWKLIGALITSDGSVIRSELEAAKWPTLAYFVALIVVSMAFGNVYGKAHLERLKVQREAIVADPESQEEAASPNYFYRATERLFTFFYSEGVIGIFPWALPEGQEIAPGIRSGAHLFVRTKSNCYYYGRLFLYETARSGEVETITLLPASRYYKSEADQMMRNGEWPISDFPGQLVILWPEIADITEIAEGHFDELLTFVHERRMAFLKARLLEIFEGETATLDMIIRRDGHRDFFVPDDYSAALLELVDAGVIKATGVEATQYTFPIRSGAFSRRGGRDASLDWSARAAAFRRRNRRSSSSAPRDFEQPKPRPDEGREKMESVSTEQSSTPGPSDPVEDEE